MEINTIRCPNCGGDVRFGGNEDTIYCDYCGSLLGIERDAETPTPVLIHSTGKRSRPSTQTRTFSKNTPPRIPFLFYLIAFVAPVAGFIFAAQYMRGDESSKSFAKVCLILAILNFVFEGVFIVLVVIVSIIAEGVS
ncbi:MAG: hypothetical protein GY771_04565 [bacterium]|nr:hypothetical protein [bacterium]